MVVVRDHRPMGVLLRILYITLRSVILTLLRVFITQTKFSSIVRFYPSSDIRLFPFNQVHVRVNLRRYLPFERKEGLYKDLCSVYPTFILTCLFRMSRVRGLLWRDNNRSIFGIVFRLTKPRISGQHFQYFRDTFRSVHMFTLTSDQCFNKVNFFNASFSQRYHRVLFCGEASAIYISVSSRHGSGI